MGLIARVIAKFDEFMAELERAFDDAEARLSELQTRANILEAKVTSLRVQTDRIQRGLDGH